MQVFSRAGVLAVKLTALAALGLLVVIVAVYRWGVQPSQPMFAPVSQPIAFSHAHHAGDDGIDCRYCHTAVEQSRTAGMPSTAICLTCHEQLFREASMLAPLHASARTGVPIAWNRVYDLPGFAYFDHSIHIAKGLACADCHGVVETMPLMWLASPLRMQWCLGCHRNPAQHVARYREEFGGDLARVRAAFDLPSERRLTDCSTCHR